MNECHCEEYAAGGRRSNLELIEIASQRTLAMTLLGDKRTL